jgi:hypothetical protein
VIKFLQFGDLKQLEPLCLRSGEHKSKVSVTQCCGMDRASVLQSSRGDVTGGGIFKNQGLQTVTLLLLPPM